VVEKGIEIEFDVMLEIRSEKNKEYKEESERERGIKVRE